MNRQYITKSLNNLWYDCDVNLMRWSNFFDISTCFQSSSSYKIPWVFSPLKVIVGLSWLLGHNVSQRPENLLKDPNSPINILRSTQVCGFPSLENVSLLDSAGLVPPDATSIPTNFHWSWNKQHFLSFSVARWCFRTYPTVLKYFSSWSALLPYSITSYTMTLDAKFTSHLFLASRSHFY